MAAANRDYTSDALRGLGIAIIVLSHSVTEAKLSLADEPVRLTVQALLYVVNVQVLSFVSGMLARRIDLIGKVRSLLIPLLAWLVLFNLPAGRGFLAAITAAPSGAPGLFTGSSPLWFLWALFASFAIAKLLDGRKSLLVTFAVVIALIWPLLPAWTLLRGVGLVFPYMLLGAAWRRNQDKLRVIEGYWPLLLMACAVAGFVGTRLMGGPIWVGSFLPARALIFQPLLLLAGAAGCIGLLGMARVLRGQLLRYVAFLGTASVGIYGFHWLLIVLFPAVTSATTKGEILAVWLALLGLSALLSAVVGLQPLSSRLFLGGRRPFYELLSNKRFQLTRHGVGYEEALVPQLKAPRRWPEYRSGRPLNTNGTPELLRLFCDEALPTHLASFVAQARASALPLVDGAAWHLCDIISRDDTLLQRWTVRPDAGLVDSLASAANVSPLEFYTHLSRARLGGLDRGLMPVDSGERLILGIIEVALLGQPASLVSLVPA